MKIFTRIIISVIVVIAVVNIFFVFYPFKVGGKNIFIPPNSNAVKVATILKENTVIKSKWHFLVMGQVFKVFNSIRAGEYEFTDRVSMWTILRKLAKGEIAICRVTIPEGWTVKDICDLLSKEKLVDPKKFMALANDSNYVIDDFKFPKNLEGYLFPDTYYFTKGISTEGSIIGQMLSQFKKKIIDGLREELAKSKYSFDKIITMASIVEREAIVDIERPIIAGVFYKRLRMGMALQSDPTVRYALSKYEGALTMADIRTKSAFNTYYHPGLPPHPICNPGIASIKASINPPSVDYLYFVSKRDGTHYFSKKYGEHKIAKRKYLGT